MPSTRPDLEFDERGYCDACVTAERKFGQGVAPIDWDERWESLKKIVEERRRQTPDAYDVVIGVSGGKDSTYQVQLAKDVLGLKPLCVCLEPTLPTEIGRRNLENLNRMGVDIYHVRRDPNIYEKLVLESFKRVGDMEWPNHAAIWALPYQFAVAFDVPLIFWGEGRMEYAGNFFIDERHLREFDEDFATDYGVLNGLRAEDFVGDDTGLTLSDLALYRFPPKERLQRVGGNIGCLGLFLGYFVNWDVRQILERIEPTGWSRRPGRTETTYTDFEGLDCLSMNLHDYLKYCKFGYGRATDDASRDIRHGYIDRAQGLRLVERYDGAYPKFIVEKFCEHFGMSRDEFDSICNSFTNPEIFEMRDGAFLRDIDHSLVMREEIKEARRHPQGGSPG
jgi:N-acetyl sugar amidotransferase